jgi:3-methyladenine DNA glycosylase Tag
VAEKIAAAQIPPFDLFFERASRRKGGDEDVLRLSETAIKSPAELAAIDDSRYLSAITKAVFKAGFVWRVIEQKWPAFEEAFWQFNVHRCAMMSPDDVESLATNEAIVRNVQKIVTVPANSVMLLDAAREHGSFANMVAGWPETDFVGLLKYLQKQGSRLGGNSAQYFLRGMGKDGFVLSKDGVIAMTEAGVIAGSPTSQRSLAQIQAAYNQWRDETGYSLSRISRILALSAGDNRL